MGVSVSTLWLIYILAILVLVIALSLPNLYVPSQGLVAAFAGSVIGALIVTFVPVDVEGERDEQLYQWLLIITYLLPLVLIIAVAACGIHHNYGDYMKKKNISGWEMKSGGDDVSMDANVVCERDSEGRVMECHLDKLTRRSGGNKVKVDFRSI
jgi:hypothetical protein